VTRRVVLDCDTGTDDAVAIMLAALHPGLELLGVGTVHGNHPVAVTTDNTLRVLDHLGRHDVEVHPGADTAYAARLAPPDPRVLPPHLPVPEPRRRASPVPAAEWLVGTARAHGPVTLVATGPFTNLAHALDLWPGLVDAVQEVVLLGGSEAVPSVTPLAERNVWNDPVAAQRVLDAGFGRLVVVPLDATYRAQISATDAAALAALGTPAGTLAARLVHERIEQYGHDRQEAPVHDPLAVATLLDPSVVNLRPRRVRVDLAAGPAYGRTWFDDGTPNAEVAVDADRERYVALLLRTFGATRLS
jgi:inosine-uridine nucleoside N-ribohydrolase